MSSSTWRRARARRTILAALSWLLVNHAHAQPLEVSASVTGGMGKAGQLEPSADLAQRHALYRGFIHEAASIFQLPIAFLFAVARVESNFNPSAVSRKGAQGLMQLMPATVTKMGISDAFDPRLNILAGARLLRLLANQWNGNLVLTIASYNAGAGAVQRHRGIPPYRETQQYVQRVLKHYRAYRSGQILTRR